MAGWDDKKIETFYQEFQHHLEEEHRERIQQRELYIAIFQREDTDSNTPAGILQLVARMSADVRAMKIAADRQKTFMGGVLFAFTAVGFFFTETAHKVLALLKGL